MQKRKYDIYLADRLYGDTLILYHVKREVQTELAEWVQVGATCWMRRVRVWEKE